MTAYERGTWSRQKVNLRLNQVEAELAAYVADQTLTFEERLAACRGALVAAERDVAQFEAFGQVS